MLTTETERTAARTAPQVSPAKIFETLNRYQHTMALKGAIDLGLFTAIAAGATTTAALAVRCQAPERGVRILCDFMAILGFLSKTGGEYGLTAESAAFLDRKSPAYLGSISSFVASPISVSRFRDVASLVRKGTPLDGEGALEPGAEVWVEFARSMAPMMMLPAQITASIVSPGDRGLKVLDIASGHGMFGIAFAKSHPATEVFALDWKVVLDVATEHAASSGVAERFHQIAGDAFQVDLGSGYDVVLLPNFLHHFDRETNVALLKRVRASLKPGGRVATIEFVPNNDRISPPTAASFSMIMLGSTSGGDAYTFRELDGMFREAGMGESQVQALEPTPLSLVLTAR